MPNILKHLFGKLPMVRSTRAYEFALDNLVNVPPQSYVLDLGAGRGFGSAYLSQRLHECHILGLDITHDCFNIHELEFGPHQPYFLLGDACQLPLADNCLDVVFVVMTFHCLPEPQGIIHEIARSLKPGGSLILADVDGGHPVAPLFELVEHMGISRLTHAYTQAELGSILRKVGMAFEVHKRPNRKNGFMIWVHGRKAPIITYNPRCE